MRKIFGHRGLPQIYIENTIKSLNKALEICDFVETDIRITKDEQLIFYQDPTIKNKKIILIDDSLVRGTTSYKIVKMLYDAGAKEVHVKIACPEIR